MTLRTLCLPMSYYHYLISESFHCLIQASFQRSLTILFAIDLGEYLVLEVCDPYLRIGMLTNPTLETIKPTNFCVTRLSRSLVQFSNWLVTKFFTVFNNSSIPHILFIFRQTFGLDSSAFNRLYLRNLN